MVSTNDVRALRDELAPTGIFEPARLATTIKFVMHMVIGGCLIAASVVAPLWATILIVPVAAVVWSVGVMMGHDATHEAAYRSRTANLVLRSLAFPLASGLSGLFWKYKHNRLHHSNPNVIGRDEDLEVFPMAVGSSYHRVSPAPVRWFQRGVQGWVFWPLASFIGSDLRTRSIRHLCSHVATYGLSAVWLIDVAMLAGHYTLWIVVPGLVFGWLPTLAYYFYFWGVAGLYLAGIGLMGHTALPLFSRYDDRLTLQFFATRNIRLGPLLSWFFVGLDYQIEHHLFPKISHLRLPLAQPAVRRFASAHGLPYNESGLGECVADITRYAFDAWKDPAHVLEQGRMRVGEDVPVRLYLGRVRTADELDD